MIYLLFGLVILQCCILIDAFRRLARTKIWNKTISTGAVVAFCLASILNLIGVSSNLATNTYERLTLDFTLIIAGFVFGVSLLATLLYVIGISSSAGNSS